MEVRGEGGATPPHLPPPAEPADAAALPLFAFQPGPVLLPPRGNGPTPGSLLLGRPRVAPGSCASSGVLAAGGVSVCGRRGSPAVPLGQFSFGFLSTRHHAKEENPSAVPRNAVPHHFLMFVLFKPGDCTWLGFSWKSSMLLLLSPGGRSKGVV